MRKNGLTREQKVNGGGGLSLVITLLQHAADMVLLSPSHDRLVTSENLFNNR